MCAHISIYIYTQYIYVHIEKFIFLFPKKTKPILNKNRNGQTQRHPTSHGSRPCLGALGQVDGFRFMSFRHRSHGRLVPWQMDPRWDPGGSGQSRLGKSPLFHDLCEYERWQVECFFQGRKKFKGSKFSKFHLGSFGWFLDGILVSKMVAFWMSIPSLGGMGWMGKLTWLSEDFFHF